MKVEQLKLEDLTATVALTIEKADYEPLVKKGLSEARRKAEIKGFRPGMAPIGLIQKMYGKSILLDEVNKLMSDGINKYIEENKLTLLGEPLPNETEQKEQNWEEGSDFEFVFDFGLAPEFKTPDMKSVKVPSYTITVSDEDKEKYKENILRQYGKLEDAIESDEESFLKVDLKQGENLITDTYVSLKTIEKKTLKKPFLGKKVGDEFEVDVKKTFTNETDLAGLLKVKKEELEAIEPVFTVIVKEVKIFTPAEVNQELFDRLFGADVVKSEDEFTAKLVERISSEYAQETDYRFMFDARKALLEKTKIQLPDAFLKRWLLATNDGKVSMEMIEKDYPKFADDLRWQMIHQQILRDQNLEIGHEDLMEHARKMARYQYSMYGLNNVPDEHVDHLANSLLSKEKEFRRIHEKVQEDKAVTYIKENATLNNKEITMEKLQKLYEEENHE